MVTSRAVFNSRCFLAGFGLSYFGRNPIQVSSRVCCVFFLLILTLTKTMWKKTSLDLALSYLFYVYDSALIGSFLIDHH